MKKDWKTFYNEDKAPKEPSTFAKFVIGFGIKAHTAIDLGSGNGRDTYALDLILNAAGVDPAGPQKICDGPVFLSSSWTEVKDLFKHADLLYSRFFLHAITWKETKEIIKLTPKYFAAEARAVGDTPKVYPEHERHFVDGEKLLAELIANGFEILHYEKRRGLAPYKDEDPLLVRVIAKRK